MFTFQRLKAHNDDVEAVKYRPKACCHCHEGKRCLRPRQLIHRLIRFISGRLVHRTYVLVYLWRCSACHRSFRHLPPFLRSHKRFVTPTIVEKASEVLGKKRKPYRKRALNEPPNRVPFFYDCEVMKDSRLSHTSVWRWIQWMGSVMSELLSCGPEMAKGAPGDPFEFSELQAMEPKYRENLYLARRLWLAQILVS